MSSVWSFGPNMLNTSQLPRSYSESKCVKSFLSFLPKKQILNTAIAFDHWLQELPKEQLLTCFKSYVKNALKTKNSEEYTNFCSYHLHAISTIIDHMFELKQNELVYTIIKQEPEIFENLVADETLAVRLLQDRENQLFSQWKEYNPEPRVIDNVFKILVHNNDVGSFIFAIEQGLYPSFATSHDLFALAVNRKNPEILDYLLFLGFSFPGSLIDKCDPNLLFYVADNVREYQEMALNQLCKHFINCDDVEGFIKLAERFDVYPFFWEKNVVSAACNHAYKILKEMTNHGVILNTNVCMELIKNPKTEESFRSWLKDYLLNTLSISSENIEQQPKTSILKPYDPDESKYCPFTPRRNIVSSPLSTPSSPCVSTSPSSWLGETPPTPSSPIKTLHGVPSANPSHAYDYEFGMFSRNKSGESSPYFCDDAEKNITPSDKFETSVALYSNFEDRTSNQSQLSFVYDPNKIVNVGRVKENMKDNAFLENYRIETPPILPLENVIHERLLKTHEPMIGWERYDLIVGKIDENIYKTDNARFKEGCRDENFGDQEETPINETTKTVKEHKKREQPEHMSYRNTDNNEEIDKGNRDNEKQDGITHDKEDTEKKEEYEAMDADIIKQLITRNIVPRNSMYQKKTKDSYAPVEKDGNVEEINSSEPNQNSPGQMLLNSILSVVLEEFQNLYGSSIENYSEESDNTEEEEEEEEESNSSDYQFVDPISDDNDELHNSVWTYEGEDEDEDENSANVDENEKVDKYSAPAVFYSDEE